MITKALLSMILGPLGSLLAYIGEKIGNPIDFAEQLIEYTNLICEIAVQGFNFVHFMVGDTLAIIIPGVLATLSYKFFVLPIIDFARRILPFVNL